MRYRRRPPSGALIPESLSATSRHQPAARGDGDKQPKKKFKTDPIGYFHIDIADVQVAEGKLRPFVAIDRTSKFALGELHRQAGKMIAVQILRNLIAAVPCTIHTVPC